MTLADALPANTTAVSLTGPAGWTCTLATLICTNPSLAPGAPATITYVVKVNTGTAAGTAINETATVSSAITDPNLAEQQRHRGRRCCHCDASRSGHDEFALPPTSVAAGSNVTYTQTVTNNGPAATTAGMTITEITPPNTTFQSMTPPAGWTCGTLPPVGGTGTITCTDSGTLAVNGTASFTLVLQVNAGTPSGTNITDTVTATAANIVPSITTNTASATVVVANANSADVAIVKTGDSESGDRRNSADLHADRHQQRPGVGDECHGNRHSAFGRDLSFVEHDTRIVLGGGWNCNVPAGHDGERGYGDDFDLDASRSTPGIVSNTATVTADQTDPNLANNSSTQTETITAPTSDHAAVVLGALTAPTRTARTA